MPIAKEDEEIRELKTIAIKIQGDERRFWRLIALCPVCNKMNYHGGGYGAKPDAGHRMAHCPCQDDYILKVVDTYDEAKVQRASKGTN